MASLVTTTAPDSFKFSEDASLSIISDTTKWPTRNMVTSLWGWLTHIITHVIDSFCIMFMRCWTRRSWSRILMNYLNDTRDEHEETGPETLWIMMTWRWTWQNWFWNLVYNYKILNSPGSFCITCTLCGAHNTCSGVLICICFLGLPGADPSVDDLLISFSWPLLQYIC